MQGRMYTRGFMFHIFFSNFFRDEIFEFKRRNESTILPEKKVFIYRIKIISILLIFQSHEKSSSFQHNFIGIGIYTYSLVYIIL